MEHRKRMQYRSISDLHRAIVNGLHMLPRDIDLVVGIPRSGLLAANMLGLVANLPMTDLDSFVEGRVYSFGATKNTATFRGASDVRKVLVLDDSINTGGAMRQAKAKLLACESPAQFVFAAVYGLGDRVEGVDFIFEVVEQPRLFQWNFMHHGLLSKACVDIDGVLCLDPTEAENDDGPTYDSLLEKCSRASQTDAFHRLSRYEPPGKVSVPDRNMASHKCNRLRQARHARSADRDGASAARHPCRVQGRLLSA
ncbi:phosphoribosyltransferase [Rhizobium beringeri]